MNTASKSTRTAWATHRIRLSFLSALAGWGAFMIYCLIMCLLSLSKPSVGINPFGALLLMGVASGVVVFAVWLVVLLPLALLIPDRSMLWKPGILTLIGLFTGPIIVCAGAIYQLESNPTITIYQPYQYILGGVIFPGLPSVLIGGVTGAVAARLHQRLLKKENIAVQNE